MRRGLQVSWETNSDYGAKCEEEEWTCKSGNMCKISFVTRSFVYHLIVIQSGGSAAGARAVVRRHCSSSVVGGGGDHPLLRVIGACWSRRVLVIGYGVIILMARGAATFLAVDVAIRIHCLHT